MKILVRHGQGDDWESVGPENYCNEAELQELLGDCPSLIPIEDIGEKVGELVVAVREFGLPGSGQTDLVCFTSTGRIVLVECKLASNQEIKRKVVGQILEYGAFLWKTEYREVNRRVRNRRGRDLVELAGQEADDEWDEEMFRENVADCLKTGDFLLLIAVDEINEELLRTIKYVNQGDGPRFSLHALEMRLFRQDDAEMLVPNVYGEPEQPSSSYQRQQWGEESFFDDAADKLDKKELAVVRDLYDWSSQTADAIRWGAGKEDGSFTFRCRYKGNVKSLFRIFSSGYGNLVFDFINETPQDLAENFYNALKDIKGFQKLDDRAELHWPRFYIKDAFVDNPGGLTGFKKAVEKLQGKLPLSEDM